MPLDMIVTSDRISKEPLARQLIEDISKDQVNLNLDRGVLYYDFPTYSDYETIIHKPDILIISAKHGVIAIRFLNDTEECGAEEVDESLVQFSSIMIGRLLKSKMLRSSLTSLKFQVTPIVFRESKKSISFEPESSFVQSLESFKLTLSGISSSHLNDIEVSEIRSVVEGAKALSRPTKRAVADPEIQTAAVALSKLEQEILNFDQKQRKAALITIRGPQRIRGLAGSGKTVILAMKAAHLHMVNPDAKILFTFLTKSLRQTIKNLVTKFYRHYREEDPNWKNIKIKHAWGGQNASGAYTDACHAVGVTPLSLSAANSMKNHSEDPFDYACKKLVQENKIAEVYDYILIDEGQDFPSGFYELCYQMAKGGRDEKNIIWAYDELQNILNVKMRTPDELFGHDIDGTPLVSLERSANALPIGAENDIVLSKCYRTQREVLVTAHALGFGIYRDIVQLLEDKEHWEDVGYKLIQGEIKKDQQVLITRPEEFSPISLDCPNIEPIICKHFTDYVDEINWISSEVSSFINEGVAPEEILIISLDDRNAKQYFSSISERLALSGVSTNNLLSDPYNQPAFTIQNRVTLSTVYRAKGNEAAVVFAAGVDGISLNSRSGRNKLFTAFTRTKAWLRISGLGDVAKNIEEEVAQSMANFPSMKFTVPDLDKINLIERDLSEKAKKAKQIHKGYIEQLRAAGISEDEIGNFIYDGEL